MHPRQADTTFRTTMTKASQPLIGRVLTGLFAAFMLVASIAPKLLGWPAATEALAAVGWDAERALPIGLIELTCLGLYLVPRTAALGAVLMTGLLGGAVAAQWRVGSPLGTHLLFGVYLGVLMWSGLCARAPRVRDVLLGMRA